MCVGEGMTERAESGLMRMKHTCLKYVLR